MIKQNEIKRNKKKWEEKGEKDEKKNSSVNSFLTSSIDKDAHNQLTKTRKKMGKSDEIKGLKVWY